jgi:hypothetical protein
MHRAIIGRTVLHQICGLDEASAFIRVHGKNKTGKENEGHSGQKKLAAKKPSKPRAAATKTKKKAIKSRSR